MTAFLHFFDNLKKHLNCDIMISERFCGLRQAKVTARPFGLALAVHFSQKGQENGH